MPSSSDTVTLLLTVLLPLLAAILGWAGWRALTYRRLPHSLRTSARLIAWAPTALIAALLALALLLGDRTRDDLFSPLRLVEAVVPLVAGIQAAFLLSPDDEPGLEVLLACPRPLAWTVLERLAVLLAWLGLVALLGGLAASLMLESSWLEGVARWLPPLFVFSALGLALTLSTRQPTFSVAFILLLWFGMLMNATAGGGLLARWPYLWPIHIYLQPGHPDYWLNRLALLLLGLNLVVLAATHLLRDEERVLLGSRGVVARPNDPQGGA